MKLNNLGNSRQKAFTMVEILIVIAVIGIMSALVISAFSGVAQDTRKVIARQQQAAVQNAVNAWVNAKSAEFGSGITEAKSEYNGLGNARAKLQWVGNYLEDSTLEHLLNNTSDNNQISSQALRKTDQFLALGQWEDSSYPKVELRDL